MLQFMIFFALHNIRPLDLSSRDADQFLINFDKINLLKHGFKNILKQNIYSVINNRNFEIT